MKEITNRNFNEEVLECQIPVFVCFVARWCYSCYPTCLIANQLAKEYDGRVKFFKIDVERIPLVSDEYRINALPTILIFKDAQLVKTLLGFQEKTYIRSILNQVTGDSETIGMLPVTRSINALY